MEIQFFSSVSNYHSGKPGLIKRVLLVLMGYQNNFLRSAFNFLRRLQLNYQNFLVFMNTNDISSCFD